MGSLATGEEHLSLFPCEINFPLNVEQLKPRVTFGGSYPGSLSAWMRLRFPHLVSGSVSSSGPLWAKLDFFEYLQVKSDSSSIIFVWQVVMDALDTTGPGCNIALAEAIATAETMVADFLEFFLLGLRS